MVSTSQACTRLKYYLSYSVNEPICDKTNIFDKTCAPAKTQISIDIRQVLAETSLSV